MLWAPVFPEELPRWEVRQALESSAEFRQGEALPVAALEPFRQLAMLGFPGLLEVLSPGEVEQDCRSQEAEPVRVGPREWSTCPGWDTWCLSKAREQRAQGEPVVLVPSDRVSGIRERVQGWTPSTMRSRRTS